MQSEGGETALFLQQNSSNANVFAFKIQDKRGRMHRFICGTFVYGCVSFSIASTDDRHVFKKYNLKNLASIQKFYC